MAQGKTTLLRTAAGIQPLFCGSVRVMGRPLKSNEKELLPHIGFTPDVPSLYETMRVREFLRFISMGHEFNAGEARERIDFWLEKVWLTDKADHVIATLSRGMRQRVALARTLLPNPAVVLLDEPSGGIDPAGRVQFRELLCDLRRQGKAMIVSSHILPDMAQYCTHIAVMAKGSLIRAGTVDEFLGSLGERRRYRITFVRAEKSVEETLATIDNVNGVRTTDSTIILEYLKGPENASRLLKELIQRGLEVTSFTCDDHNLEAAYLQTGIKQVD